MLVKGQIRGVLAGIGSVFASFEKRLIGALVLITVATMGVQVVSILMARSYTAEVEALAAATLQSEQAGQLAEATQDFRLAAYRMAASASAERHQRYDELTDAAVNVSGLAARLRNAGVQLYEGNETAATFDEIDKLVERYRKPTTSAAAQARAEQGLVEIGEAARSTAIHAVEARTRAYASLEQRTRERYVVVTGAGALTLLVVIIIFIDLASYILPEIRAVHNTLQRLSGGELDVEVPISRLTELRALSDALETMRRNALVVTDLAFKDPSTGLPNRRAFVERASRRLANRTDTTAALAVIHADIDRFKHINDDFGHAAGDLLVSLIGARMRELCGPEAIVARVGGDEFAVFLAISDGRTSIGIASALVADMRKPFSLEGTAIVVTLSLGVAETNEDSCFAGSPEEEIAHLLNRADLALYASKSAGRNRATMFSDDLEDQRDLRRALEHDLAQAAADGQLRMVYQPILKANGDDVYREVEALARWDHPTLGSISPARFIPVAERCGLMHQLGAWIMDSALSDLAGWPDMEMSINLSPLQLQQEAFVGTLLSSCARHGIAPRRLFLEVTESISIECDSKALLTLELLRCSGFRIALDDFGTGYSSLNLLKSFNFDRFKLDRSLIVDLDTDISARAVFDAAVTMALAMNAEVVAEGISEAAVAAQVLNAGCTHVQGFQYCAPIEAAEVLAFYNPGQDELRLMA